MHEQHACAGALPLAEWPSVTPHEPGCTVSAGFPVAQFPRRFSCFDPCRLFHFLSLMARIRRAMSTSAFLAVQCHACVQTGWTCGQRGNRDQMARDTSLLVRGLGCSRLVHASGNFHDRGSNGRGFSYNAVR